MLRCWWRRPSFSSGSGSVFGFWRTHRALTCVAIAVTFAAWGAPLYLYRDRVFALRFDLPTEAHVAGWALIILWSAIGMIADRQIGMHVRSFGPHFEPQGRITLLTTGAYG